MALRTYSNISEDEKTVILGSSVLTLDISQDALRRSVIAVFKNWQPDSL